MEIGGAAQPLRQNGWHQLGGSAVLRTGAHSFTWLRDLRALGTDAARLRARALVSEWIASPPSDPIAHRPDVVGARITAWLGHYDFFAATADDVFRQRLMGRLVIRRAQPVRRPAGRGTRRPRTDRAERSGRRRRRIARTLGLPDPRTALPAAGDQPPDPARWLPRRTQPGRAVGGVAGPDRNPRAVPDLADPAAADAGPRDRAHGPGAAHDAARRRRPGAVQRQQGGDRDAGRSGADPGRTRRPWPFGADRGRLQPHAGRPQRADRRLRRAGSRLGWTGSPMPAPCRWNSRSAATG